MAGTSANTFKVPSGNFEIRIGSDSSCEFSTPHLPPMAAGLRRRGDRLFVKDLGCRPGLTINDKKIRNRRWFEVTRYDNIKFGKLPFNLNPAVFLGRDRLNLDSSPLKLVLSGGKTLCDGVYIRAKNGNVTAIMGPSGAGKTVFLNMINGYTAPTEGKIFINKKLDLQIEYPYVRDFIGYVPQDDIMIPELTLRQSLNYRLRLRYPDMASSIRSNLIEGTCNDLGFKGDQLSAFLDTVIGSPESGLAGLSGGEKRRANIAHELVLKPLILILDEPTSGLSSVDSEYVVKLLCDLAKQNGLTIVATIHQPSRDAYQHFDDLLLIGLGGKVAYYGRSDKAVDYFENGTGIQSIGRNPPEFLMSFLSKPQDCDQSVKQFAHTIKKIKAGSNKYNYIHDSIVLPTNKNPSHSASKSTRKILKNKESTYQNIRQWFVLLQRNLHVLLKDKLNLLLLLGQVPIIGLLMFLAFYNFTYDQKELDQFSRIIYHFGQLKAPYEKGGRTIPFDSLLRQAIKKAKQDSNHISELGSRHRGAIYFVLVAASIWFGIIGGCKEIVTEQHILKRELRSCVNLTPYLLSKLTMLILLVGFQTAILSALISPLLLNLMIDSAIKLWLILWITAFTSAALGLCVSCYSPTYRFALTAVPLLLIPQLIFGGLIRPFTNLEDNTPLPQIIGALTIQRWGFQASLSVDTFAHSGVLKQLIEVDKLSGREEFNIIQYKDSTIMNSFFQNKLGKLFGQNKIGNFFSQNKLSNPVFFPLGVLIIFNIIFAWLSYWRLKRKFSF